MKIAFCLFKYFPYGGLQRDFLRIAKACERRGHEIHVYTMDWEGEKPAGFDIHLVPAQGFQNHVRNQSFAKHVGLCLSAVHYDLVVGFNKLPGLDIYYAADVCYQSRAKQKHSFLYRLLPRYKRLVALEKSIFASGKQTEIFLIAEKQQEEFARWYQTEPVRFHLLPPGVEQNRVVPIKAAEIRATVRDKYHLNPDQLLLLMVGSGFKTKGLDRAIQGLRSLPQDLKKRTRFFVIGQDHSRPFQKLAEQLQVADQLHFLGGRDDVPSFLLAADLLVHPAYHENTGTVLLEAMIYGLPILTMDTCGYAHYVKQAGAGIVLSSPYQQDQFNEALQKMLLSPSRAEYQENGLKFGKNADIYSLPEKAVNLIEYVGSKRVSASST